MGDRMLAWRPAIVHGKLTLWDMGSDKCARFRSANEVSLATALCDVEWYTGQRVYMEYRFHPTRRWRFDGAVPSVKVAVEIEGMPGIAGKSRHMTYTGYQKDIEKYNAATALGWHLLRFTWKDVRDGSATKQIVECVNRLKGEQNEMSKVSGSACAGGDSG